MSGSGREMSDGSNGSADDPELKEISPGVKYRDLKEGAGAPCPPGALVVMHYTGWLTNGVVFDSTKDRGGPSDFELKGLIKGWQEGIPGMKPGGIRKLVISPEKGYGSQSSGKIPADSTLIFEVQLVRWSLPRRSPIPTDLSKLSDGTAPNAADPDLKPIGKDGLMYRDLKEGVGEVVPAGASVVVDYIGWRHSDGGIFDSSFRRNEAFGTPLSRVVEGWQEGIPGMKVGGIRKLVIPPGLAYGNRAQGADIPANSTLVFEIEVLGFK
jgi:peptidylprolyl isomerase